MDGLHRSASDPRRRRPRLLLLITLAEVGGAQSYVAALLPALTRDFDVAVAAHGPGPLQEAAATNGARFIPLEHVRRPVNPLRDLAGLAELVRLFRRERPDIVHANSSKAGILGRLAAALARVPIRIFTVHGWAFAAHSGLASRFYYWADRLMSRLTSMTICVSDYSRAQGLRARTCTAERTVVIPNAVDIQSPPAVERSRKPPVVIAVGRLKAPKDFLTLVRGLALLQPGSAHTRIVGDGPDRTALEAEIRRLGIGNHVELLGERRDVPELLAGADVFVLSSSSEGMPVSVLEAMAVGLPVVGSSVGGVPELVVDGETGLLVPPGDPSELARALDRVLADAELRRRLGEAGRDRAQGRFTLDSFRRAHVELYSRELAMRKLPVPVPEPAPAP